MIVVLSIENHKDEHINALCEKYIKRSSGIYKMGLELLPAARVQDPEVQKIKESEAIEKKLKPADVLILCDETGVTHSSIAFSQILQKELSVSRGKIYFAIGGAYGFTKPMLDKYPKIRLSDFTFPHHLARLVLVEQIYRASEIAKGTGYHHI